MVRRVDNSAYCTCSLYRVSGYNLTPATGLGSSLMQTELALKRASISIVEFLAMDRDLVFSISVTQLVFFA